MIPFDVAAYLRNGLRGAGWAPTDLWVAALGIGGNMDLADVRNITSGERAPSPHEYDVLAVALNEQFDDLGRDHPMQYWHELPTGGAHAPPEP